MGAQDDSTILHCWDGGGGDFIYQAVYIFTLEFYREGDLVGA